MTEGMVLDLGQNALTVALTLSMPILVASLAVGLVVAVFQAVTQIHEMTLTFVPKILAVVVAGVIFGPWMLKSMLDYTTALFVQLPGLVR